METINFTKSKRTSKNVIRGVLKVHYRYCSSKLFYEILLNGEKVKRNYLVYSESTGSVFCAPCKLFGSTSVFSTLGFLIGNMQRKELLHMKILKLTKLMS